MAKKIVIKPTEYAKTFFPQLIDGMFYANYDAEKKEFRILELPEDYAGITVIGEDHAQVLEETIPNRDIVKRKLRLVKRHLDDMKEALREEKDSSIYKILTKCEDCISSAMPYVIVDEQKHEK